MLIPLHTALATATTQLLHSETPRLDAEVLLSHVLGVKRSYLLTWPEKILTPSQYTQYQSLLALRTQGKPIAYLLGYKEFWSLKLQTTTETLIPRPETELLVELALAHLPINNPTQVIDLGTGTGAIALAIASERPHCSILASDNSPAALKIAHHNAQQLGLDQVKFILSDWWTELKEIKTQLVVSNPPYIAIDDPHLTQGDVRHEPRQALVAGVDGLTAIRQLVRQSYSHLITGGWLLLEHGYNQAASVQALLKQQGYQSVTTYHDLAGLPRVTEGQKL